MRLTQSKDAAGQPVNASIFTSAVIKDSLYGGPTVQVNVDETATAQFSNMSVLINGSNPSTDDLDTIGNGGSKSYI